MTGSDSRQPRSARLAIRSGASPQITHNVFARNGLIEASRAPLIIEDDAEPRSGHNFWGDPKVFECWLRRRG